MQNHYSSPERALCVVTVSQLPNKIWCYKKKSNRERSIINQHAFTEYLPISVVLDVDHVWNPGLCLQEAYDLVDGGRSSHETTQESTQSHTKGNFVGNCSERTRQVKKSKAVLLALQIWLRPNTSTMETLFHCISFQTAAFKKEGSCSLPNLWLPTKMSKNIP